MLVTLFSALPFAIAFLLAVGLSFFIWALYSHPMLAVSSILLLFLWETAEVRLFGLNLGLTIYPQDLLFACLGLASGLRLLQRPIRQRAPKSLWLLAAIMAVSFAVGLVQNGSSAGVEFRSDFYFVAGTFYFLGFEWNEKDLSRLIHRWMLLATGILLIVAYRWVADAFGLDWFEPLWRNADSTGVAFRVIDSSQAFVLGEALLFLLFAMALGRFALTEWRFLVPSLTVCIIVLQHRSVWGAAFLPAVLVFTVTGGGQRLAGVLSALFFASVLILFPLAATGKLDNVLSSVTDSAVRATSTTDGTFVSRVQGWNGLLKQWMYSGPRQYAIGSPYGSGFARYESEQSQHKVVYAPHNYFVQTLLRTGLMGLASLLAVYVHAIRGLLRLRQNSPDSLFPAAAVGLLAAHLLYYIPYSPQYIQSIVLGVSLSLAYRGWHLCGHDTGVISSAGRGLPAAVGPTCAATVRREKA